MKIEKFEQMVELQEILKKNNQTITCAESCTGGLIASRITEISGSSSIFRGSIITYCNHIKEQELNVKKQTMVDNGVVSVEVVKEMLDGVLKKFDATYAIAVSGVAGPTGGTKNKPVGTVVIGIKNIFDYEHVEKYHFDGNRREVQEGATNLALKLIFNKLKNY